MSFFSFLALLLIVLVILSTAYDYVKSSQKLEKKSLKSEYVSIVLVLNISYSDYNNCAWLSQHKYVHKSSLEIFK